MNQTMKLTDLMKQDAFQCIVPPKDEDALITTPYCCDLLSAAMKSAPEGCAWCTVMNNVNTLAVASLCEAACVILCDGIPVHPDVREKAVEQQICVFETSLPIFEAALTIYQDASC